MQYMHGHTKITNLFPLLIALYKRNKGVMLLHFDSWKIPIKYGVKAQRLKSKVCRLNFIFVKENDICKSIISMVIP